MINEKSVLFKLKDAGLSLKRQEKLKNLNITIYDNDTVGIYGLNGSGKSLLAELIAGKLKIDNGTKALKEGLKVAVISSAERKRMLEEDRYNDDSEFMDGKVDPGRSVKDIFRLSMNDDGHDSVISRYSQMFGITHILSRGIKFLSTGEFRKMMIVSSLLSQPDILILDDPYTGLDIATRAGLHDLIEEIQKEVKALVFISGRLDDLDKCRRVFMLDEGRLQEHASSDNIRIVLKDKYKELPGFDEDYLTDGGIARTEQAAAELIRMTDVKMSYYDELIISDVNWKVSSG